jgi:alkylation response protein AidB-like acyl-CoA dehydrogenase
MEEFFQDGPQLKNQYDDDPLLRLYLKRALPAPMIQKIEGDLRSLGARAATDILELGDSAEKNPPLHIPFDAWGRRVDEIQISPAWKELERLAATLGLVGTAYARKEGALSRIHQFAKVYLFASSSAIVTCPLAMSDGAARALELYGDKSMKENAFRRLVSFDPDQAWTSGQWMTERSGGSDVGRTSTVAKPEGGAYRLYGTKWFTSATTSQMAMTLARIEGAEEGSRGLSLFYLELRNPTGELNGIRIHRLKDKLGTRALPTAELTLDGSQATLVGGPGGGVKKISSLFNITRIWNAFIAVSYMRRGLALAKDYAQKRSAFGKLLMDQPLHVETLADLQVELEGALLLAFRTAELLGKEETGEANADESSLLRLLTPIVKLFTAKQAIQVSSEVLEGFGGAGYIEDTGLPRLLRDVQVLSIWEGTTNVLSLDVLRAIGDGGADALFKDIGDRTSRITQTELRQGVDWVKDTAAKLKNYLSSALAEDAKQAGARSLALALAKTYTGALLLDQAQWELTNGHGTRASLAAQRWCSRGLLDSLSMDTEHLKASSDLASC